MRLEAPPDFWETPFARLAAECGIDPDIAAQFAKVERFYASLNGHTENWLKELRNECSPEQSDVPRKSGMPRSV